MLEIFQYDFMIRAFTAGMIIAILAPTIGIFLVIKRYSLLADTLAHVSLFGVALGVLLGINPIGTSIIISTAAALGVDKLRRARKIFGESVLALFLSGGLAASLIVFGLAWVGQFIGHGIEGKKPSFLHDLQFLLIGPAWLMGFIYRRLGIVY